MHATSSTLGGARWAYRSPPTGRTRAIVEATENIDATKNRKSHRLGSTSTFWASTGGTRHCYVNQQQHNASTTTHVAAAPRVCRYTMFCCLVCGNAYAKHSQSQLVLLVVQMRSMLDRLLLVNISICEPTNKYGYRQAFSPPRTRAQSTA